MKNWYKQATQREFGLTPDEHKQMLIDVAKKLVHLKRELPKIPANTCPKIDQVISNINSAAKNIENVENDIGRLNDELDFGNRTYKDIMYELGKASQNLAGLEKILEEIREANEQLRTLGVDWYDFAKQTRKTIAPPPTPTQWGSLQPSSKPQNTGVQSNQQSETSKPENIDNSLQQIAMSREIMPRSKPLSPEERANVAEFFWSHFK